MEKFNISKHDLYDKFFFLKGEHIFMEVEYDDVNHAEVDAASELVAKILNEYWDEDTYHEIYREKLIEIWNKNQNNLQDDFDGLVDYLNNYV